MGLEAILSSIRASEKARIQQVNAKAQAQAEKLLADSQPEIERLRKEAMDEIAAPAIGDRARTIYQAQLKGSRMISDIRDGLIEEALGEIHERLSKIRGEASYPAVLQTLIQEALDQVVGSLQEGEAPVITADSRDRELVGRLLAGMGHNPKVTYGLKCWGGLVAKSPDGRVVVTSTLESRLQRAEPFLRRRLAAVFQAGEPGAVESVQETATEA